MLTGIATVSLGGTLEAKIEAIAAAGFDGLEVFEGDLVASPSSPAQVARRCEELMLGVDLYQPFRDFEGVGPDLLERNLERARRKLDLAAELGAGTMLVCANVATATVPDHAAHVDQLGALADLAGSRGVRIAYEALAWSTYVSTYPDSWDVVRDVDHPWLGLCLDSFHICSRGTDLAPIAQIPGEKIFFCQVADAPPMSLDPLSWSRHHRRFPGEGGFDLVEFLARVVEAGYDGPLSAEVFNDVFRQADPQQVAVAAQRSLRALEDATRERVGGDHRAARLLSRLTPLQEPTGISAVATTGRDDPRTTRTLEALGFVRHGRRAVDQADEWVQGPVRLRLGSGLGPGSGPVPTAAGLSGLELAVADPGAALRRADQLLIPRAAAPSSVLAPRPLTLTFAEGPATGGTGGGTGSEDGLAGTGITGIDHVSVSQPWRQVEEAVLFHRALLGLRATEPTDVADPLGLVRSQVLRNDDATIQLVLNVLPAGVEAASVAGHAEHVAFTSDDAVRTVQVLGERGLDLLPIPDNYYADLGARFALTDARLDELRRHHLLYDEDEHGWFLQAYTADLDGFFFEIVQRVDGYRGFGATNAAVRRTAQRAHRSR